MRSSTAAPALLLALALTGCGAGDESAERAADPAPATTSTPSVTPSTPTDPSASSSADPSAAPATSGGELVSIVTETAVGGTVSPDAVPVGDPASVQAFAEQFGDPRMLDRLTRAVQQAEVPDGQVLLAATVAVGCDVPTSVDVVVTGTGVQVTATSLPQSPRQQCLAAMTSVALVAADDPS